jgi:hypothetical protein
MQDLLNWVQVFRKKARDEEFEEGGWGMPARLPH